MATKKSTNSAKTTIANKPVIQRASSASPRVTKRPTGKVTIATLNKKVAAKVVVKPQAAKSPVIKANPSKPTVAEKKVTQAPVVEPPSIKVDYREQVTKSESGVSTASNVS